MRLAQLIKSVNENFQYSVKGYSEKDSKWASDIKTKAMPIIKSILTDAAKQKDNSPKNHIKRLFELYLVPIAKELKQTNYEQIAKEIIELYEQNSVSSYWINYFKVSSESWCSFVLATSLNGLILNNIRMTGLNHDSLSLSSVRHRPIYSLNDFNSEKPLSELYPSYND